MYINISTLTFYFSQQGRQTYSDKLHTYDVVSQMIIMWLLR